jgi:phasin family protein
MTKQPEMANKPAMAKKPATIRKTTATRKAVAKTAPKASSKAAPKAAPKVAAKPKAIPMSGDSSGPEAQASAPVLKLRDKAAPKAVTKRPEAQVPVARVVKSDDQMAKIGKDGLQVYVRTGSIMVKGFEDFSREIAVYAQAALEVNVAAAKAMAQAGSFDEMLDLQTKAARESIDIMLAEGAKLTELSLDLANKSMEPLQDQVDKTVATLLKPLAA